ncbi:hypothetical protein BZB76_6496 [Actinomadura pelletieri DSM 43383]|uniref:Uncharacterized protein n=1 Tax=Actinomadura pelletieri DSM 43383 TaxID=1120940 RepID=A0A495Q9W0_9ACTN|nr:hypothetical protein [Actinomadura pelletieri]RKS68242.1 hypothetical protein BZB76_6496 [Actinomadura pelletieri DSM 43383]
MRVLFILDRLGEACIHWPQAPSTAVRAIQSQRKLQKLDFLIRNPDYLADLIISRWQDGCLPPERLLDARAVFKEREPELHTYRMLRNDHGAYEALDNALSMLRHLGLIAVRRAGSVSDERVRRRDYFLLQTGADQAQRLREDEEVLAWYDQQTAYVAAAVTGMTGAQLKQQQYGQPEYAATPVHQMIGGITERVRERLDAALAQEGLA